MNDLVYIVLGITLGIYFVTDWKKSNIIEWSKNMELFVFLSVFILLCWLLYLRYNNYDMNFCIQIIILFLTINATFHLCLYFDRFRKTK